MASIQEEVNKVYYNGQIVYDFDAVDVCKVGGLGDGSFAWTNCPKRSCRLYKEGGGELPTTLVETRRLLRLGVIKPEWSTVPYFAPTPADIAAFTAKWEK